MQTMGEKPVNNKQLHKQTWCARYARKAAVRPLIKFFVIISDQTFNDSTFQEEIFCGFNYHITIPYIKNLTLFHPSSFIP